MRPTPVTNTNDSGSGSLRNALATAIPNDTIDVPPGTYSLTSGQLVANDNNLTLRNQPGASMPIIQSTGNFRVLCVTGGNEVTVRGLTIQGGRAAPGGVGQCNDSQGGGIHAEDGILNVENSVVQHNTASPAQGGGGGIFAAGELYVLDSIVRHNSTTAGLVMGNDNGGGGIRWTGTGFPEFEITDSSVYGNTATVGGSGSGGGGVYSNERPTLRNVTFSANTPSGRRRRAGGRRRGRHPREDGGRVDRARHVLRQPQRPGRGRAGGSQPRRWPTPCSTRTPRRRTPTAPRAPPTPTRATPRARPHPPATRSPATRPASIPSSARLP